MITSGMDGFDSSDSDGEEAKVNIRGAKGLRFYVRANLNSTVVNFKSIVAQECGIPAQQQRLIHQGRIMKDDRTLRSYGLEDDQTVYLSRGFAPAAPADTITTTGAGIQNTNSTSTSAGSNVIRRCGRPPSFFPKLDRNGPRLGSFPEIKQMRQLVQNPKMVRYIFRIPIVRDLFNNPETVCNMLINKHPLRDIVDRNPEVGRILDDPVAVRQILHAARDPEIRREMICNTNRAMSNIKSPPGRFNCALRQLSEDLEQGERGPENTIISPAPNTNPLPNPWASAGTERTHRDSCALGNSMADSPGALDFPDLQWLPDSILNLTTSIEYQKDPFVDELIGRMLHNPRCLNQMFLFHPQLRKILDSNPQIRDVMQNPQFIRRLATPEIVNAFLLYHSALVAQVMEEDDHRDGEWSGDGELTAARRLRKLMDLFGELATLAGMITARAPQDPPEYQYATQLSQLQEMGFLDTQENIRALIATLGNVRAAVERLLRS